MSEVETTEALRRKCRLDNYASRTRAPKKLPCRALLFSSTRRQSDDATYVLQEECHDEVDDVEDARQDEDVLVFALQVDNDDDDNNNICTVLNNNELLQIHRRPWQPGSQV